jgi:hypothetical protein
VHCCLSFCLCLLPSAAAAAGWPYTACLLLLLAVAKSKGRRRQKQRLPPLLPLYPGGIVAKSKGCSSCWMLAPSKVGCLHTSRLVAPLLQGGGASNQPNSYYNYTGQKGKLNLVSFAFCCCWLLAAGCWVALYGLPAACCLLPFAFLCFLLSLCF